MGNDYVVGGGDRDLEGELLTPHGERLRSCALNNRLGRTPPNPSWGTITGAPRRPALFVVVS